MARGRAAVRMSEAEVAELLDENVKVQVASIGPDGSPHLTTLFYVRDPEREHRLAFWTYGTSQKVANLRRDPRVTCLVEAGEEYSELRGVSIRGRAELSDAQDDVRRVGGLVTDMLSRGEDLGELRQAILDAQAPKRVVVWLHPDHVASWDHRKLG